LSLETWQSSRPERHSRPVREIDTSQVVAVSQKIDFSHVAADITGETFDGRALGASNVVGKVTIRFKVNVIESACQSLALYI